jgi:epsilon-lactone hydrolase
MMTPSLPMKLLGFILRITGVYRRKFSGGPNFDKYITESRATLPAPSKKLQAALNISQSAFQSRVVWRIAPKDRTPTAHLLYWHGGGYVYPPAPGHWDFLGAMAKAHGWSITAPLYPLAPEFDVDGTTKWANAFYKEYAQQHYDAGFIMGGDSAGGGLTAAVAMAARDTKLPAAKGLILICPWLNAVPDDPAQPGIEPRDCILTRNGIREAGALYAGANPVTDTRVSPIHGDWDNLPPIISFGGGDDILVTDARALKAKLPASEYFEGTGLMHVWPILPFAEARAAQRQMVDFAAA